MGDRRCGYCPGPGAYTCPRCSVDYCGIQCYQCPGHRGCSEAFYKECVQGELVGGGLGEEATRRMQAILKRQQGQHEQEEEEEGEDEDSDDGEEEEELASRLEGVDLEDVSKVWSVLSAEERRAFGELVTSGGAAELLPEFEPWWRHKVEVRRIQEVGEEDTVGEEVVAACPTVCPDIPSLQLLSPSPYVKFGLLNLLYAFAYTARYLQGELGTPENLVVAAEVVGLLAATLEGRNFELADTAVEAAASEVNNHQWLAVSLEHSRAVKKDVYELVKGPTGADNFYVLAALSQLKEVFSATLKTLKEDAKKGRKRANKEEETSDLPMWLKDDQRQPELKPARVHKHLKKIEFYLSWTKDFYDVFKDL